MRYQFAVLLFCTLFAYLSAEGNTPVSATYGVAVPVTSTETTYIFHSATGLTSAAVYPVVSLAVVDSDLQAGSTAEVNVSAITIIPSASSAVATSYPVGYTSLAHINGLEGFAIEFIGDQFAAENYTGLTAYLTVPVPANYTPPSLDPSNTAVQPHFALLYFNPGTNNYGVVPESDITDLGKTLRIVIRQSIRLFYVLYNPLVPPTDFSPHNGSLASFLTTAGADPANITLVNGGQRILTLLDFTGNASGVLTIGVVDIAKELAAVPKLRRLVSSVFNFTHSGGNDVSTTLAFDFTQLNLDQHEIDTLSWYKYNASTSSWDLKGGIIIGGNITFHTTSFSDWSVQSNGSSSSESEGTSSNYNVITGSNQSSYHGASSSLSSFLSLLF